MTRTFSDIDDIGRTPHFVENRFRLNGAAAIFEIIHTQELESVETKIPRSASKSSTSRKLKVNRT